jgi:hypothetical protein
LDDEVETMAHALALTMPDSLAKTIESVRKKKNLNTGKEIAKPTVRGCRLT